MSVEFIKEKRNASNLTVASRQQKQLSYFTQSIVQEDITLDYIKKYAERNYRGNDYFLNYVKMLFRSENFLSFFKYLRYPLVSSKLVNDEIKPQLKRVYYADDSFFKYIIKGAEVENPEDLRNDDFEDRLFDAVLFRHNDIIIHDLKEVNKAYRQIVCIDNVVSIESKHGKIKKIAYCATVEINEEYVEGYLYMDSENYIFYDKKLQTELKKVPHDLGKCPATWISNEAFSSDNDIVRKSIFSYVREELEELVFLKTLLKMTEPNGVIPISVQIKTSDNSKDGKDIQGINDKTPALNNLLGSQKATVTKEVTGSSSILQAGTQIKIPLEKLKDTTGKFDSSIIQNFIKFHNAPIEALNYLDKRIKDIERSIITDVLGDYSEMNDTAKNELQVSKSYVNKQDKLRYLAVNLSWVRNQSDYNILGLNYGKDRVSVDVFYGSDFFLDNETELYKMFKDAPNQIERRNILVRIGKTKYRFNKERAEREKILYSLLPFASDLDFDKAISNNLATDNQKKLQLMFSYWISLFEAEYGDITIFYNNFDGNDSEKLIAINNLLINLIQTNGTNN